MNFLGASKDPPFAVPENEWTLWGTIGGGFYPDVTDREGWLEVFA